MSETSTFLAGTDIEQADVENALGSLLGHQIDYGEIFLQKIRSESWGLEDGIVKDGSFSVDAGIGVRSVKGEKTGFAYTEDL